MWDPRGFVTNQMFLLYHKAEDLKALSTLHTREVCPMISGHVCQHPRLLGILSCHLLSLFKSPELASFPESNLLAGSCYNLLIPHLSTHLP